MTDLSDTAMVLAAGMGMGMRPLTLTKPKPLHEVGGKAMIDHAIDKLVEIGMPRIVVNSCYLAEQIEAHVQQRRDIDVVISREEERLETGGGILRALNHFGGKPFFALNADLPWIDGPVPSLERMRAFWNPNLMDALLLLMPTKSALGFVKKGVPSGGDFFLSPAGVATRADTAPPRPYVYIGAQIIKPSAYDRAPAEIFSNNAIWDRIEAKGRLYGIVHDGACYHVGTPEALADANQRLTSGQGWRV